MILASTSSFPAAFATHAVLWHARLDSPQVLRDELVAGVDQRLPLGRAQTLGFIRRTEDTPAPAEQIASLRELQVYQEFTPLPFDRNESSRLFFRDRMIAYATSAGATTVAYLTDIINELGHGLLLLGGTLLVTTRIANAVTRFRQEKNREQLMELLQWQSDWPDMAIYLVAAASSARRSDRIRETHFLAQAAMDVYPIAAGADADALTERLRLTKMARLRGSHHAAHWLWLAREAQSNNDGLETTTDLSQWEYDASLVRQARSGHPVALDTVNLAIRESESFRTTYYDTFTGTANRDTDPNWMLAQSLVEAGDG